MIIVTAGHVDHGKTTLVKALTGVDTDTLVEEKSRGLTIDLGFAYADTQSGNRLGFIDVPGHIRFINNMIAGVCAVEFALIIIAADDGPMPQTAEHLAILDLLGVKKGAVALTKIDRVDKHRIALVKDQIRTLMNSTALKDSEIFPVSALTGAGIDELTKGLDKAATEIEENKTRGFFRLAIDRCFTIKGAGIVVTGSVFSGTVSEGDFLNLQPSNLRVRVRGLRAQDRRQESASSGDRCALNIVGNNLSTSLIHRGNWLYGNTADTATNRFDIKLSVLKSEITPISHWTPVHVHSAANHVSGRIALIDQQKLIPGKSSIAQIVVSKPINVCIGDHVIIRDQSASRTLGGGPVLDPFAPSRGRSNRGRTALLGTIAGCLDKNDYQKEILEYLIKESPEGIDISYWSNALGITTESIKQLTCDSIQKDNLLISTLWFRKQSNKILDSLDSWHKKNPDKGGLSIESITKITGLESVTFAQTIVTQLVSNNDVKRQDGGYALKAVNIGLTDEDKKIWALIRSVLQKSGLQPPVIFDLAKETGVSYGALEKTLVRLGKIGCLVRPTKNRVFLSEDLVELEMLLKQVADSSREIAVGDYRDAAKIGRNLAIEILEYFDRRGITKRFGQTRRLMKN
ncbi:MAG: selenocysteine-specific translation elongation factor [Pseudomonadota bacterium]|nr:selenocysteine-specific translation elongation factor [Pseudomonadota bacterium]